MIINDSIQKKLLSLKNHILPASSVLIVTHDYPDPDCLATAYGIQYLCTTWGVKITEISFGGFIGRAENRAMIRFLNLHTVPIMLIECSDFERIVLVDASIGDAHVSLPSTTKVHAIIDHHPHKVVNDPSIFHDIRNNLGSTSTIVTEYFIAANIQIPPLIATALFYGIKTDTNHLSRNVSSEDLECYKYLFDLIDHRALARIESPDRDAEYFRVLHRAAESMMLYNNTIGHTHLGFVTTPDYIPEIADLFHSLENLEWMICSGIFKNQIFFSLRARNAETAGKLAEKLAKNLQGNGGGHTSMAAGRIPLIDEDDEKTMLQFTETIKKTFELQNIEGHTILK